MEELTVDHGDDGPGHRWTHLFRRQHCDGHCVLPEGAQLIQRYRGDAPIQLQDLGQLPVVVLMTFDLIGVKVGERSHPGAGEGGGGQREAVDGPDGRRTCGRRDAIRDLRD